MKNSKIDPIGAILVIACAVLAVGTKTFFGACEVSGEEVMSCHYAEQAVFGVSIVLLIQGVCALFMGLDAPNIRKGICIAMVPTAVLAAVIPGYLIDLCEDSSMACNSGMKSSIMILSFGIAVLASMYASQMVFAPAGRKNKDLTSSGGKSLAANPKPSSAKKSKKKK